MKAVLCPVCNGTGRYLVPSHLTPANTEQICHGCGGKGWVEVREEPITYIYYPSYVPEYPPYYTPDPNYYQY